jgi:hypothetical protein
MHTAVTNQFFIKMLITAGLLFTPIVFGKESSNKKWVCRTWQWEGSVYNRKVYCVEWVKRDCSNRLYKDICKYGG